MIVGEEAKGFTKFAMVDECIEDLNFVVHVNGGRVGMGEVEGFIDGVRCECDEVAFFPLIKTESKAVFNLLRGEFTMGFSEDHDREKECSFGVPFSITHTLEFIGEGFNDVPAKF